MAGRDAIGEVPQRLDEGLVGDAQLLVAPAGEDDGAPAVGSARHLGGQARLAHAGLAGQEGHAPVAGGDFLPQLLQTGDLAVAADEDPAHVGQEVRQRH